MTERPGLQAQYMGLRGGGRFFFAGPQYSRLEVSDLAFHLSCVPRFAGAAGRYTVAHHSLFVSHLVCRLGGGLAAQLAGLLHDGHEMVTGDIIDPVKGALGRDAVEQLQNSIDVRVVTGLGLKWGFMETHRAIVKQADDIALITEVKTCTIFPEWDWIKAWHCPALPEAIERFRAMSADDACSEFIETYYGLMHAAKAKVVDSNSAKMLAKPVSTRVRLVGGKEAVPTP